MKISKRTQDRMTQKIKHFQLVATAHRKRDVSEADTVTLVKDIMSDVFGFDKYQELTSEQQIRGTYCDLAVKIDGKIKYLIEVKAAGIDLHETHLRQAINYGVNQGIEWVVLTNAIEWRLHRIKFGQPIENEEISKLNLLDINTRNPEDIKKLFLLSKEGVEEKAMNEYHEHTQILNKFTVTQILNSEPILSAIRKEMRKLFPDLKVSEENLSDMLKNDILKREVIEGDQAKEAASFVKRATNKLNKRAMIKKTENAINPENDIRE